MAYPFTTEQFFGVFNNYNTSVWPAQIFIYLAAVVLLYFVFKPSKYSNKVIATILAALWLWMGIVYHLMYFTSINPAAKMFGIVFILQGLLFLFAGFRGKMVFGFGKSWASIIGLCLVILGPVLYPIIGYFFGHTYPNSPTFGLPCPTTIFTFGVLLMSSRMPKYIPIIPFLWSILGFMAAVSFGVKEDILLLLSGIVGAAIIMFKRKPQAAVVA